MFTDQQAFIVREMCDFKDIENTSNLLTHAMERQLLVGHFQDHFRLKSSLKLLLIFWKKMPASEVEPTEELSGKRHLFPDPSWMQVCSDHSVQVGTSTRTELSEAQPEEPEPSPSYLLALASGSGMNSHSRSIFNSGNKEILTMAVSV